MMVHELKIYSDYFEDVVSGRKTFEIRKNDRNFQVNDMLLLMEILDGLHTGHGVSKTVGYILEGGQFGIAEGYVIMSLI